MRLLTIAPRGWDRLPPLLASRSRYLAWVSERIPDPYPPNVVFQRWHQHLDVAELIAAHEPERVIVLAWGDAAKLHRVVAEAAKSGTRVVVAETATARLPTRLKDVSTVDVRCFPSSTGDDPFSRAMAVGKLLLPESAASIPVSCPAAEEVVEALLGDGRIGRGRRPVHPLVELLDGVNVRIVPDGMPRAVAMVLARLVGALYWPTEVWLEYRAPEGSEAARDVRETLPDSSIDSSEARDEE